MPLSRASFSVSGGSERGNRDSSGTSSVIGSARQNLGHFAQMVPYLLAGKPQDATGVSPPELSADGGSER